MLRYSLGSLFLALLYLSIGCAALVNASGIWPQVAITLTVSILVVFSLAAIFWTERRRVFAIGFTATGWLYFLLVFSSVTDVRPYLLTETALSKLFVTMHSDQLVQNRVVYQNVAPNGVRSAVYMSPVPGPLRPGPSTPISPGTTIYPTPSGPNPVVTGYATLAVPPTVKSRSFINIGHSMWAVIVAFVGGVTAQLLAKSRKQPAMNPEKSPV